MPGTSCFRKFLFRETPYQFVVIVKYNPDNPIRNIHVVIFTSKWYKSSCKFIKLGLSVREYMLLFPNDKSG